MTKFRILSDLHVDYNNEYPFDLEGDTKVFTLIAGDVAGWPSIRKAWLRRQIDFGYKGVFVEGNHVVYHNEKKTLDEIYIDLRNDFPLNPDSFSFLENNCILIKDILIIGCTLWTDYNLYDHIERDGYEAEHGMNDFRFKCIKTLSEEEYPDGAKSRWNNGVRNLKYTDQIRFHEQSLKAIDQCLYEHKGRYRKVILVTHHAPTQMSIGHKYVGSRLNAAYASRLSDFILNRPEICLWVHGHVHEPFDYQIGNCHVICNPRGYVRYYEDTSFKPNLIVNI